MVTIQLIALTTVSTKNYVIHTPFFLLKVVNLRDLVGLNSYDSNQMMYYHLCISCKDICISFFVTELHLLF